MNKPKYSLTVVSNYPGVSRIGVSHPAWKHTKYIDARYSTENVFDATPEPSVNWGALGDVSPDEARAYAAAILKAADVAEENFNKNCQKI